MQISAQMLRYIWLVSNSTTFHEQYARFHKDAEKFDAAGVCSPLERNLAVVVDV